MNSEIDLNAPLINSKANRYRNIVLAIDNIVIQIQGLEMPLFKKAIMITLEAWREYFYSEMVTEKENIDWQGVAELRERIINNLEKQLSLDYKKRCETTFPSFREWMK